MGNMFTADIRITEYHVDMMIGVKQIMDDVRSFFYLVVVTTQQAQYHRKVVNEGRERKVNMLQKNQTPRRLWLDCTFFF
jgi:hypothetical protein